MTVLMKSLIQSKEDFTYKVSGGPKDQGPTLNSNILGKRHIKA